MIGGVAIAAVVVATGACLIAPFSIAARGTSACAPDPTVAPAQLDEEQASNLAVVLDVGDRYAVGESGKVIAVMTALTESSLRNLDHGDAAGPDSRGLFQQRASWGSIGLRMDPGQASALFYLALTQVKGWAAMEPWDAAQAVQRSAFSDGSNYRKNHDIAVQLVGATADPELCGTWSSGDSDRLPGADEAVDRAMQLVGSHGYHQLCARLAANIWGRPRAGYFSAADQWTHMVNNGEAHRNDRRPPVGALLFWATDGPFGHVAVYVGGGRIVSNDIGDGSPGEGGVYLVGVGAIEQRWGARYLGWAPPIYA